jgi:hypothetical protein
MSEQAKKLDIRKLKHTGMELLTRYEQYKLLGFLIFVAIIYGFVWMQINNYNNAGPSSTQVSSQVQAAQIPHINQTVISQLQSLQDNSVSVQALFNQERNNPFQ